MSINWDSLKPSAVARDAFPKTERGAGTPGYEDTPIPQWVEDAIKHDAGFSIPTTRDNADMIGRLIRNYLNDKHSDKGLRTRTKVVSRVGEEDSGEDSVIAYWRIAPRIQGRGRSKRIADSKETARAIVDAPKSAKAPAK